MAGLETADPVAVVGAWLEQHPRVLAAFGTDEHISGIVEAPWPHLRVTLGQGGDPGDGKWLHSPEVLLEVYSDPRGQVGQADGWRLAILAQAAAVELELADYTPGDPVVAAVAPTTSPQYTPLTNGQHRWVCGVKVTLHPPVG